MVYFFFGHAWGKWMSLGQGSNLHHSRDQSHSIDNTESLTNCTTRQFALDTSFYFSILTLKILEFCWFFLCVVVVLFGSLSLFLFWKNKTLISLVIYFLFPFYAVEDGLQNIPTNNTITVFPILSLTSFYPAQRFLLSITTSLGLGQSGTKLLLAGQWEGSRIKSQKHKDKIHTIKGRKTCICV